MSTETLSYVPPRYLTCAETAKLVRKALKHKFPGVKFSVRSSTYSGGASIRVGWVDGPISKDVERIAGSFSGADFDGMVDLKTYSQHWLNPDGSVTTAHAGGGGSTIPEYIGSPLHPRAELVSFGADYVFSQRTISDTWRTEILAEFSSVIGREIGDPSDWGIWQVQVPLAVDRDTGELLHMVERCTSDLSTVFHQYTGHRAR